jgi:hypothetical protein
MATCYPARGESELRSRGYRGDVIACRLLGHRYRFRAEGPTMRWECMRGCGAAGEKRYATEHDATRYAAGLERDRQEAGGGRMPFVATLPLRLLRRARRSRHVG